MKITKTMRFLLVALAAAMVFSLFACTDPVEGETTAPQGNEATEATGNETTAPKGDETTEPQGGATTAPAGDDTTEPAGEDTTAPKGDDTTTAPKGDDETEPKGDDTTTAPKGDDETEPKGDDTTTAPKGDDETEPKGDDTTTAPKGDDETEPKGDDDTEAPHEHTWVDATCKAPKTCACGATEGEPIAHTWVDATCKAPKTCSACGNTEGEALAHTWADATCTAPKTCSACGDTEGEALPHTEVYTEVDATNHSVTCADCSELAKTEAHTMVLGDDPCYKVCSKCNYKSETHEAITVDWTPVLAPEGGVDNPMEQKACTTCGTPVETRPAAFVLCPDNLRIDGTTTAHIANNNKNQTSLPGFGGNKKQTFEVEVPEILDDGKFVTTSIGLGGWIAINGGTQEYVYRVNGGAWQKAIHHGGNISASNTAHIDLIEKANLGIKDYYANVLLDSGIFTNDLQAEFGGQTIVVEFGAVPANNPGTDEAPNAIVIARYTNVKVFKTTAIETIGDLAVEIEAGSVDGALYAYKAESNGVFNVGCPVIEGVNYSVTLVNLRNMTTEAAENAGGKIIGISAKKGDTVIVKIVAAPAAETEEIPALSGTFTTTYFYGAYGADFITSDPGNCARKVVDGYETVYLGAVKNDVYFTIFSGQELKVSENRYMALTYKLTGNVTCINSIYSTFTKADGTQVKPGDSGSQSSCKSFKLINDGQWHTVVIDLYELLPSDATLNAMRFDTLENVDKDSTFAIKGIEFNNDHRALTTKLNSAVWESAGSALSYDHITNAKELERDADGNFVFTNKVVTSSVDCSVFIINEKLTPGRYFTITVKAGNADTYVSQIYFKGLAADGVTTIDYKNAGSFYVNKDGNEGEWVTIIVDMYALLGQENALVHTIRFDACEYLSAAEKGNITIKHWGIYNDLDLALASGADSKTMLTPKSQTHLLPQE